MIAAFAARFAAITSRGEAVTVESVADLDKSAGTGIANAPPKLVQSSSRPLEQRPAVGAVVEALTAKGVSSTFTKERLTFAKDASDPMAMSMLRLLGAIGQF